jgi:hypothetical protein
VSLHFNRLQKASLSLISRVKSFTIRPFPMKISYLINSIRVKGAMKFHLNQRQVLYKLFYDHLNVLFVFAPLSQACLSSRVIYLSNHLTDFVKVGTGRMNYKLPRELNFSPSPPTNAYFPVMLKSYIIKLLGRLIIGQEFLGYEVKAFISLTDHFEHKRRPSDHRLSFSFSCMSQNISLRGHSTCLFRRTSLRSSIQF